jgi:hypothetical protein
MATGKEFANIEQYKLMGYKDFGEKFLEYLRDFVRESLSQVWDAGAVIDTALTMSGDGTDSFAIGGSSFAADGDGKLLKISDATVNSGIKFENASAAPYYVALKYAEIPKDVDINPRTGLPSYTGWFEEIGESDDPDSVTDNGSNITLQVDSVTESGVSNAGRQVLVYLKQPAKNGTTAAVAIETCTVVWTDSQNQITTTSLLGQSTVSTDTSDYTVVLLGPTVKKNTDLRGETGYTFVGIITGNTTTPTDFDTTDQQLVSVTLSQIGQIFFKASNGRLKIDIRPEAGESGINQLTIRNEDGQPTYEIDEVGNINRVSIPVTKSQLYPTLSSNSITGHVLDCNFTSRCITICEVNRKRKLLVFTNNQATEQVEVWDVDDMSLTNTIDISSTLPSGVTWNAITAVGDSNYVYVYFYNTTEQKIVIQAYDISNISSWVVKTNWPTTGLVISGQGTITYPNTLGNMMLNLDGDRLIVGSLRTDVHIYIINKSTSNIITQGSGDVLDSTHYTPWAVTTDGKFVYYVGNRIDGLGEAYLFSCDLSDLSNGSNGTNWPMILGTGFEEYEGWAHCYDGYIMCSNRNSRDFAIFTLDGLERTVDHTYINELIDIGGAIATHDGVWFSGSLKNYTAQKTYGASKPAIFKFTPNQILTNTTGISRRSFDGNFGECLTPYVIDDTIDDSFVHHGSCFVHDGIDIYVGIISYSVTSKTRVYRFARYAYKDSNTRIIALPKTKSSIQDVSGVVAITLDPEIKHYVLRVTDDITSFTLSADYQKHISTATFTFVFVGAAVGTKTIDGFPAADSEHVWDGPTPPFDISYGKVRTMAVTYVNDYLTGLGRPFIYSMGGEGIEL